MSVHPWVLVAPWYRWDRPAVPGAGRGTAPVFQKFASDTYVLDFLVNPQHSLRFEPGVDEVQELHYTAAPKILPPAALAGKITSLFPTGKKGQPGPFLTSLRPTGLRKIYLDTHSRHYLVVCELHCDLAGFPSPDAREVCQAGLVVRRRHLSYPDSARAEAQAIVKDLVAVDRAIAALRGAAPGADCGCGPSRNQTLAARLRSLFKTAAPGLPALEETRAGLNARLAAWRGRAGAHWLLEGWIPGDRDRIGAWGLVEDEPQDLVEAWSPMWALFADPARPDHDAAGRTIFYGVLPSASFDTDLAGKARFDDHTTYEVRCFVRRHDPRCPRGAAPDCRGELVWSRASERYRLAPPFDLLGTSNRPVTIQLPNLAELAAQATQLPIGKFSPVKIIQPQSLSPKVTDGVCTSGTMGGPAICFISIPLITIVAYFVFSIFLPIVVFVFGLWFLLAFKFCIPPQIDFGVGLELKLEAVGELGLDLDADFSINVEVAGVLTPVSAATLNAELKTTLAGGFADAYGFDPGDVGDGLADFSSTPLKGLADVGLEIQALPGDVAADPPVRGNIEAEVRFETPVTRMGTPA